MIMFPDGFKIGKTNSIDRRIKEYKRPWCKHIKDIEIVINIDPDALEAHILKCFTDRHGEWFNLKYLDKVKREVLAAFPLAHFKKYLFRDLRKM